MREIIFVGLIGQFIPETQCTCLHRLPLQLVAGMHGPALAGYGDSLLIVWHCAVGPKMLLFERLISAVSMTSSCGIFRSGLSLFLIADSQLTFG
jgi:hypothetical protein